MAEVTLPTPVALAAGGICVLGGYLLGIVLGPETAEPVTGTVLSYQPARERLCLRGPDVADVEGAREDGRLCGTWRRTTGGQQAPVRGDRFRFVSLDPGSSDEADPDRRAVAIYGDVVP